MAEETKSTTAPDGRPTVFIMVAGALIALFVLDFATNIFSSQFDRVARFRALQVAHYPDRLWDNTFFDVPMHQFPADFVAYQEAIWLQRPDVIVETGTFKGGNAAYLASLLHFVNPDGKVITIDIIDEPWNQTLATHKLPKEIIDKIIFIKGDSTGEDTLAKVRELTKGKNTMVVLDALHKRDHVRKELELYSPLVPVGGYIVVNDAQLEIAMWREFWNDGPGKGRDDFLATTDEFVIDQDRPRHFIANTREGFLKRVK